MCILERERESHVSTSGFSAKECHKPLANSVVTLCQSALATDARSKKGWEKAEITAPSVPTTATGCSYAYTSTGNVHCLNVCLYIYI